MIKGDLCYVHLKQQHLRVKPSTIHGNGLFAIKAKKQEPETIFKKNEEIVEYKGDVIDDKEADKRELEGKENYFFKTKENYIIDAYKTTSGVGRYANDPRKTGKKANARFSTDKKRTKAKIVAIKPIKDKSEILVPYGSTFWKGKKIKKTKN